MAPQWPRSLSSGTSRVASKPRNEYESVYAQKPFVTGCTSRILMNNGAIVDLRYGHATSSAGISGKRAPGALPSEVIDFFAPPRDDFLVGGKPAYMSEG